MVPTTEVPVWVSHFLRLDSGWSRYWYLWWPVYSWSRS